MTHPVLTENESKRLSLRMPLLLCFVLLPVWQMGVLRYTGKSVWEAGGTGISIPSQVVFGMMLTAYAISIAVALAVPHRVVVLARVCCLVALVTGAALLLPVPPLLGQALYTLHDFSGDILSGFEMFIIVNLFREKTAVRYLTAGYAVAMALIAVFYNDILPVPTFVFRLCLVLLPAAMLRFFFALPAGTAMRRVEKGDGLTCPKRLFTGVYWMVGLGGLVFLFGHATAERVVNGLPVFTLSVAAAGVLSYALWRKWRISPIALGSVFLAVGVLGFITAVVSEYVPALGMAACVLLGVSGFVCGLMPLFGLILAKQYPSRFIAPGIIFLSLAASVARMVLITIFYYNKALLNLAQLAIGVSAVVLYLVLAPYLAYGLHTQAQVFVVPAERGEAGGAASPRPEAAPLLPTATDILAWIAAHAVSELGEKELRILDFTLNGYTYKEIAREMHYSENTIRAYRRDIYSKIPVHTAAELRALAKRAATELERGAASLVSGCHTHNHVRPGSPAQFARAGKNSVVSREDRWYNTSVAAAGFLTGQILLRSEVR